MSKSKKEEKKVTIFVVHTQEEEEDDQFFPDDDDDDCVQKQYLTRSKKELPKVPKIPISKRFLIKKGSPITDLKSLIMAFDHPKADQKQKEFVETLIELDNMIGMTSFKEQIINQILFFVQDMQEPGLFLHTVLTGPPGSGKTSAINILAKIYSKMGILETDKVVRADRASLIGKWLGSTAIKTKEVLESAKGGVLLLDEVYALGNKESSDSFSKECIDTINQYLSEHVDDFICVIAGYKDQINECFFSYNPGLERRFPWRFTIDAYAHEELCKIMINQLDISGWKFDKLIDEAYISGILKNNKDNFKGNGGDTKNFLDKCKIAHARRVFTLQTPEEPITLKKRRKSRTNPTDSASPNLGTKTTKILMKEDIEAGLKYYLESRKKIEDTSYLHMYS